MLSSDPLGSALCSDKKVYICEGPLDVHSADEYESDNGGKESTKNNSVVLSIVAAIFILMTFIGTLVLACVLW